MALQCELYPAFASYDSLLKDVPSSGADTAVDLLQVAKTPIVAVVKGHRPNAYFGDAAFKHPEIVQKPSISHIEGRTAHFIDGTSIEDVDAFIVGTGYSWTLPFLPQIPIRNNRVPNLYQHIFHQSDPTLVFIGAVSNPNPQISPVSYLI